MNPLVIVLLTVVGLINAQCTYYTIQPGDTYDAIARRYGATASSLNNFYQLNPGVNCNNLQIGQSVCVPYAYNNGAYYPAYNNGAYNPGYACSGRSYTVQAGDTCYSIAQRYGTTTANVQSCIGVNCSNLQVGQVITF
ncbi:N-acetylmuramoyl-L-alanine amidase [Brachionus plicatilis]|uniref:N-acetylmuramoyl-L-alanine amidase n=1 Tax=Brachionus plicatilis TaxID=10195 RepID=A0A3M7Q0G9_BRAPC|nr:N-acetylmuramoyl-L-alanine amidase [Brachionus plicatilis]